MRQMYRMWIVQQIVSEKDICVIRYADTLHEVESLNRREQSRVSEGWLGLRAVGVCVETAQGSPCEARIGSGKDESVES